MTGDAGTGLRWQAILPLSITVMVAFGIMFYGFSVYLTDEAAGGDFSTTALSLAYGGAVMSGGLLATPVGRHADRHGVRRIIGLGSLLGFLGLIAFAAAGEAWHVVAAWWFLIGPAGAMTFYEPAFIAIDQWCTPAQRPRALAALTVIGGLAGVVFIPGIERLVAAFGWRSATVTLGIVLLATGGATALFAMPKKPLVTQVMARTPARPRQLVRDRRFQLYTAAMMLSFLAAQGVFSHRVARFEDAGFAVATVALWAAAASALSLPGRWLAPLVTTRLRATTVQAAATALIAVSVLFMAAAGEDWQMSGHFILFGLGFGAMLPLRPLVMADWYSGVGYGQIMGLQWTAVGLTGAAGPVIVGVMRDQAGDYRPPSILLAAVYAAVTVLIVLSGRQGGTSREPTIGGSGSAESPS